MSLHIVCMSTNNGLVCGGTAMVFMVGREFWETGRSLER